MTRREFRNWGAALKLLLWLRSKPFSVDFDLDCEVFNTRCYSGRQ